MSVQGAQIDPAELNRMVRESLEEKGHWETYRLLEATADGTPVMQGMLEIVRCTIVKEFLEEADMTTAVPRMSPDFLSNFEQFDLNPQEGYLMSLIDGRSTIERLIKVSPMDRFSTLFTLARLRRQKAISILKKGAG